MTNINVAPRATIGHNNDVNDRSKEQRSVAQGIVNKVKSFFNDSVAGGVSYYAAQRTANRNTGSLLAAA